MTEVKLYTQDEAAEILNLSRRQIGKLRAEGELPWVKIGAAVRIRSDDLREFIEERTRENGRRFAL